MTVQQHTSQDPPSGHGHATQPCLGHGPRRCLIIEAVGDEEASEADDDDEDPPVWGEDVAVGILDMSVCTEYVRSTA